MPMSEFSFEVASKYVGRSISIIESDSDVTGSHVTDNKIPG
jgi:hypothetical protein